MRGKVTISFMEIHLLEVLFILMVKICVLLRKKCPPLVDLNHFKNELLCWLMINLKRSI